MIGLTVALNHPLSRLPTWANFFMTKPVPLSPATVADWLDQLSPVAIKNGLIDYLRWQAAHGKILLHFAHYARVLHFKEKPRESTMQKRAEQFHGLTKGIGKGL